MNRQEKADAVESLKQTIDNAVSLVVADYRGLKVEQVNNLRREIHKTGSSYKVVKNTLFKRAIVGTKMAGLAPLFQGPTAIAYNYEDPSAPARVIEKFADDLEHLTIKGGYVDGQVLSESGVKDLAKMKSKDELRAQLLATFMAPAQGFVRLLAAAPQNFLYLLQARERGLEGK